MSVLPAIIYRVDTVEFDQPLNLITRGFFIDRAEAHELLAALDRKGQRATITKVDLTDSHERLNLCKMFNSRL
jgi:hypothetical protein